MLIGIKYCGGCNPHYDRVKAVENFFSNLPEHSFVPASGAEELLVIVCGCPIACAGQSDFPLAKKVLVHRAEQLQQLAQKIKLRTDIDELAGDL